MEISAQELRIGNYINGSIGDDSELVLCYVTGYDPRDEFIFVSNDNNIHYAEFVDFQPIPLTKEWLLKLRFNQEGSDFTKEFRVHADCYSQLIITIDQKNAMIYMSTPDGDSNNAYLSFPHFVHQLQNLYFSLCGEELIIKQLA